MANVTVRSQKIAALLSIIKIGLMQYLGVGHGQDDPH